MASTKLNKEDRKSFIANALHASFDGRFDALQALLTEFGARQVAEQHPAFVLARSDAALRPYVTAASGLKVKAKSRVFNHDVRLFRPAVWDGTCNTENIDHSGYRTLDLQSLEAQCDHPYNMHTDMFLPDDSPLLAEYRKIWADFEASQETLRSLIHSYAIRERFEADFPALAKYLPPRVVTVRTAVTVPVKDVMDKLMGLGIPPVVEA